MQWHSRKQLFWWYFILISKQCVLFKGNSRQSKRYPFKITVWTRRYFHLLLIIPCYYSIRYNDCKFNQDSKELFDTRIGGHIFRTSFIRFFFFAFSFQMGSGRGPYRETENEYFYSNQQNAQHNWENRAYKSPLSSYITFIWNKNKIVLLISISNILYV